MTTDDFQFIDTFTRDREIQKILNDKNRKPIGKKDPSCVRISIILELTDSIISQNDPGHVGVGIGSDFYDYGPRPGTYVTPNLQMLLGTEKPKVVPGQRWWDDNDFDMDKNLRDHIKNLKKEEPDYAFVVFSIYVCKENAMEVKNYWERLYKAIDAGKAGYSVPGLHCTSAVLRPLLGKSPIVDRTSPGMLFTMLADSEDSRFHHSCGENKGQPVKMYLL